MSEHTEETYPHRKYSDEDGSNVRDSGWTEPYDGYVYDAPVLGYRDWRFIQ